MTENYITLLTPFVRGMENFGGMAEAVVRQAEDLIRVIPELVDGFSVTGAVGKQLDQVGESMGVKRIEGMSDEDYRTLLRAKLALWRWDGTNRTVKETIEEVFPGMGIRVKDNGDLTVMAENTEGIPGNVKEMLPLAAGIRMVIDG